MQQHYRKVPLYKTPNKIVSWYHILSRFSLFFEEKKKKAHTKKTVSCVSHENNAHEKTNARGGFEIWIFYFFLAL